MATKKKRSRRKNQAKAQEVSVQAEASENETQESQEEDPEDDKTDVNIQAPETVQEDDQDKEGIQHLGALGAFRRALEEDSEEDDSEARDTDHTALTKELVEEVFEDEDENEEVAARDALFAIAVSAFRVPADFSAKTYLGALESLGFQEVVEEARQTALEEEQDEQDSVEGGSEEEEDELDRLGAELRRELSTDSVDLMAEGSQEG